MIADVLVPPLAYLLGSISWGVIIGKVTRGVDVRHYGSGATGMTNVLRVMGPRMAVLVLVLDLAKGVIAVLLAKVWAGNTMTEALAGILVIAGHNWPVFGGFHGGRGVTTGVGGLAVVSPLAASVSLAVFIPTVVVSRYVSLGSVLAVSTSMIAVATLVALGAEPWQYLIYAGIGGPMILWRHKENIRRLLAGTERRLGQAAETPPKPSSERQS